MKRGMALFLTITIILSLCVGCSSAPSAPTADLPEEEIFTKTVHDFKNRRIENLDQQENTNFIVYAKGVEEITVSPTTNTLVETDYENLSYTFTNADKTLLSMKKGDVFFAPISESCPEGVTVKVKEIVQTGDRVTVFSQELGFGDMFEYIDIFMEVPLEQSSLRQEGIYRLSAEQGPTTIPINKTFTGNVEISSGAAKMSFETYITVQSVTVKLRFSREHMQLFCDIWTDTTYGGSADIEGEWNPDKWSKTLAVIPLRIGALISVPVELNAVASASGKTDSHVEFKESKRTGFTSSVSQQSCAYQPIDQVLTPMSFANSYFGQMEAQVNLGLEIKPTLRLGFLGRFNASCTAGVNITAHMAPPVEIPEDGRDKIHDCDLCVDGDVNWFLNLGVGIETRLSEVLEEIVMIEDAPELFEEMGVEDEVQSDIIAAHFGGKITDFYVTMRDGNWDFGWGECTNNRYKTTVTLTNSDGGAAAGAIVTAVYPDGRQEETTADSDGVAVLYLPTGESALTGSYSKESSSGSVQVEDAPAEAALSLRENRLFVCISFKIDGVPSSSSAYSLIQDTVLAQYPDAILLPSDADFTRLDDYNVQIDDVVIHIEGSSIDLFHGSLFYPEINPVYTEPYTMFIEVWKEIGIGIPNGISLIYCGEYSKICEQIHDENDIPIIHRDYVDNYHTHALMELRFGIEKEDGWYSEPKIVREEAIPDSRYNGQNVVNYARGNIDIDAKKFPTYFQWIIPYVDLLLRDQWHLATSVVAGNAG